MGEKFNSSVHFGYAHTHTQNVDYILLISATYFFNFYLILSQFVMIFLLLYLFNFFLFTGKNTQTLNLLSDCTVSFLGLKSIEWLRIFCVLKFFLFIFICAFLCSNWKGKKRSDKGRRKITAKYYPKWIMTVSILCWQFCPLSAQWNEFLVIVIFRFLFYKQQNKNKRIKSKTFLFLAIILWVYGLIDQISSRACVYGSIATVSICCSCHCNASIYVIKQHMIVVHVLCNDVSHTHTRIHSFGNTTNYTHFFRINDQSFAKSSSLMHSHEND